MIGLLILLILSACTGVDPNWSGIPADDPDWSGIPADDPGRAGIPAADIFAGVVIGSKFVASEWRVAENGIPIKDARVAGQIGFVTPGVCNGVIFSATFFVTYTSDPNYEKGMRMPADQPNLAAVVTKLALRDALLEAGYKNTPVGRRRTGLAIEGPLWDKTSAGQTQTRCLEVGVCRDVGATTGRPTCHTGWCACDVTLKGGDLLHICTEGI